MFICEIWLFHWYFPQFCKSDMSKYGYLEMFQRVPSRLRDNEIRLYMTAHIKSFIFYDSCQSYYRMGRVRNNDCENNNNNNKQKLTRLITLVLLSDAAADLSLSCWQMV